jgi:hypothetical protein
MKFAGKDIRSRIRTYFIRTALAAFILVIMDSCACDTWCKFMNSANNQVQSVKGGDADCECLCRPNLPRCEDLRKLAANNTTTPDSAAAPAPTLINSPLPGEYFSTVITAGPNLSFKSSKEEYSGEYGGHEPGVGMHLGVGTVLPFNSKFALAPSIRFSQKNAGETLRYSQPGGNMEFTDKYTYNYVGGMMLAQFRVSKNMSLVAGPEINYLLSARMKSGGGSGTGDKQNITKSSARLGADILAGIKYDIPVANGRSKWGLQLIYDHRLSRLNKKKDDSGMEVPAYNVTGFQLGLAYNICGCGKNK